MGRADTGRPWSPTERPQGTAVVKLLGDFTFPVIELVGLLATTNWWSPSPPLSVMLLAGILWDHEMVN